ncbi:MAG: flagellar hook-basal body complex protein [Peptococcaceae bacterium]|nr:flagellar hook-basal body complex protein [Peptococcaceae bacterium]
MIRSLFSGASGMKNHQIRMDVIANNVANVNTTGFKGSRCNFQDTLYQLMRSPSSGYNSPLSGGVNPSQVGLGVMVSSITSDTGQGNVQSTGRTLDVAVQGNGWFIISTDGAQDAVETGSPNTAFTREGIFYIDNVGNLVNSNGYSICDMNGKPIFFQELADGERMDTINIEQNGIISYTLINNSGTFYYDGSGTGATDRDSSVPIGLAVFANQDGLRRDGQNLFRISPASGEGVFGQPYQGGYGFLNSGFLEMSNVDLTDEFVYMITTQRGYQANARTVTTSDQILEELLNIKR